MKYKLYLVGGYLRDEFLGIKSNDVDYSVVVEDLKLDPHKALGLFVKQIEIEGFKVFKIDSSTLTVRAMFSKEHKESGVADFVLTRREIYNDADSRTPTTTVLGSLEADLQRRDLTINALARDVETGKLIDLYNGLEHINRKILKTPKDPFDSFNTDSLRVLRVLRFHVTKGFGICSDIINALALFNPEIMKNQTSTERIQVELDKMFRFNTMKTLDTLQWLKELNPQLYQEILRPNVWLKTTTKER